MSPQSARCAAVSWKSMVGCPRVALSPWSGSVVEAWPARFEQASNPGAARALCCHSKTARNRRPRIAIDEVPPWRGTGATRMTSNGRAAVRQEPCCDDHLRAARERKDILAMQALAPLSLAYLPWSVSAMRPSGVVAVLNEIFVNQRRAIVELGSGVSSFYIGRLLQYRGGRLWTVEHDEHWAGLVEKELEGQALDDVV